ncbi:MAG TPA: hypothetical protein VLE94_01635 [Burkholderiaceae bacterium]|nr:hypothetical protein [Burkholderiaceae bacterium]
MARNTAHFYRFALDDKSTDFADMGTSAQPAPASWNASERSSFDHPSRVAGQVRQHRDDAALQQRLITLGLLLAAAIATALIFFFAPH